MFPQTFHSRINPESSPSSHSVCSARVHLIPHPYLAAFMGFSAFLINFVDTEVSLLTLQGTGGLNAKYVVYVIKIGLALHGDDGDTDASEQSTGTDNGCARFRWVSSDLRADACLQVPKLPQKKFFFNFDEEFINRYLPCQAALLS
eukprot:760523-Hanusia_phi.AAC.1